jgi:hypothetical protein
MTRPDGVHDQADRAALDNPQTRLHVEVIDLAALRGRAR